MRISLLSLLLWTAVPAGSLGAADLGRSIPRTGPAPKIVLASHQLPSGLLSSGPQRFLGVEKLPVSGVSGSPARAAKAPQAVASAASPIPPRSGDEPAQPGKLVKTGGLVTRRIEALRELWAKDEPGSEELSGSVARSIHGQLSSMAALPGHAEDPLLGAVAGHARLLLRKVGAHVQRGVIDPKLGLRTSAAEPPMAPVARELRVGVYPVAADPFHWAHLLVGLQAIARLQLDKVVFVLAGDDARKPNLTKAALRHPMGQAVLAGFAPFFAYSPIALGTSLDGESNLFRLLALNPAQSLRAFYMVGDDHYRLTDKNGNPDTLAKLERNQNDPALGFDFTRHAVSVAFNEREGHAGEIPTPLEVRFLPKMPFPASSTEVRDGRLDLMPYSAYEYARAHGLYGIAAEGR